MTTHSHLSRMEFLVAGTPVDYMAVNSDGFRKGELIR